MLKHDHFVDIKGMCCSAPVIRLTQEFKSMNIGEVADQLKTTIRTIRYYEDEGLLEPHRTDGGTRLYSDQHINRLKAILHLVNNGFSLEVIRLIGTTRKKCTGCENSPSSKGCPTCPVNKNLNEIEVLNLVWE
jgi:DNA-binding transcriptional MerR regulator